MSADTTCPRPVDYDSLIRTRCNEAIKASRAYRKVPFPDRTVWQCSELKGAARLARGILKVLNKKRNE